MISREYYDGREFRFIKPTRVSYLGLTYFVRYGVAENGTLKGSDEIIQINGLDPDHYGQTVREAIHKQVFGA